MHLGLIDYSQGQGPSEDAVQEAGMEIPSGPATDTPRATTEGRDRLLSFEKYLTVTVIF